jgi:hypothetical protein
MGNPLRSPLLHLGSIHGRGSLSVDDGGPGLGPVSFEIDSYSERGRASANGRIEGSPESLAAAFKAGSARIRRDNAADLSVVLWDPAGEAVAEIRVTAPLPAL